jgi:hypothetical protein
MSLRQVCDFDAGSAPSPFGSIVWDFSYFDTKKGNLHEPRLYKKQGSNCISMKLDFVLCLATAAYAVTTKGALLALLSASLAAPFPRGSNAIVKSALYLNKAQKTAIFAAVERKFQKNGGGLKDDLDNLRRLKEQAQRTAQIVKANQFATKEIALKISQESAAEQDELKKAAKNGGFWGLVERAKRRTTSNSQIAVLPETNFLKGRRLFGENEIAAFRKSPALEQVNTDGTRLIKTRLGDKEKILAISDISLGGGGFGDTFLAQDVASQELIAFKILKHESKFKKNLKEWSDLSSETRAWRSQSMLETEIVEFGDGRQGFGMKLLKGQTVYKDIMGAQSLDELRDVFERGIVAIKKMHEGGMAHGDLHSENILTGGGVVDWGSTRPLNAMRLYQDYSTFISDCVLVLRKYDGSSPLAFQKQFRNELALWHAELLKAFNDNRQQKWRRDLLLKK